MPINRHKLAWPFAGFFVALVALPLALGAATRRPLYVGPTPELAKAQLPYGLAIALGTGIAFALRHLTVVGGVS